MSVQEAARTDAISTPSEMLREMLSDLRVNRSEIDQAEYSELRSAEKTTIRTMRFSVTEAQREMTQAALKKTKGQSFPMPAT